MTAVKALLGILIMLWLAASGRLDGFADDAGG